MDSSTISAALSAITLTTAAAPEVAESSLLLTPAAQEPNTAASMSVPPFNFGSSTTVPPPLFTAPVFGSPSPFGGTFSAFLPAANVVPQPNPPVAEAPRALEAPILERKTSVQLLEGEVRLQVLDTSAARGGRTSNGPEIGDHIMGRFRNQAWYPGTLAQSHADGTWTIHYDDGDVEAQVTMDRIRTMEEFEREGLAQANNPRPVRAKAKISTSITCPDGSVVECTDPAVVPCHLENIFDGRHGLPGSDGNDWRVRPGKDKSVNLSITLGKPYFVSRVHVYPYPFDKKASSDYTLTVIPAKPGAVGVRPISVTPKLVQTEYVVLGERHEYFVNQHLSAVVFSFPPLSNGKQYITLAGVEIFHIPARLGSMESEGCSTFSSDFAYLLNNPHFSDCELIADGTIVHAHKNILAARSRFFKNMFEGPVQYLGAEQKIQQISLPDVSAAALLLVLRYLYTDQVKLTTVDEAVDLWCVADRYQLVHLKALVEQYLEVELTCQKAIAVCRTPSFELYEGLKNHLVAFLATHFDLAMDLDDFVRIPPLVLHEILVQVKASKAVEQLLGHSKRAETPKDSASGHPATS